MEIKLKSIHQKCRKQLDNLFHQQNIAFISIGNNVTPIFQWVEKNFLFNISTKQLHILYDQIGVNKVKYEQNEFTKRKQIVYEKLFKAQNLLLKSQLKPGEISKIAVQKTEKTRTLIDLIYQIIHRRTLTQENNILKQLQKELLKQFETLKSISLPTISKALKQTLRFRFKKVSTRYPPTLNPQYKDTKLLTAKLLLALHFLKVPLVFIDEYHVDQKNIRRYNWVKKGQESYIIEQFKTKPFSLTAAITSDQLIFLKICQHSNNEKTFCSFLRLLKIFLENKSPYQLKDHILIYDNIPFHKTNKVKQKLKELGLRAITNCPYTPEFNACEYYILSHKQKINIFQENLKKINYRILLELAYDIKQKEYEDFYNKVMEKASEFIIEDEKHYFLQ